MKIRIEELQCIIEKIENSRNNLQLQIQEMNEDHLKEIRSLKDDVKNKKNHYFKQILFKHFNKIHIDFFIV